VRRHAHPRLKVKAAVVHICRLGKTEPAIGKINPESMGIAAGGRLLSSQVMFRPKRVESFVADRKLGIASEIFILKVRGLNKVTENLKWGQLRWKGILGYCGKTEGSFISSYISSQEA
jgi:hypothetical protein